MFAEPPGAPFRFEPFGCSSVLGVLFDFFQSVGITRDLEPKAPAFAYTGLPEVLAFVILLGVERWMVKVLKEPESVCRTRAGSQTAPRDSSAGSAACSQASFRRPLTFLAARPCRFAVERSYERFVRVERSERTSLSEIGRAHV